MLRYIFLFVILSNIATAQIEGDGSLFRLTWYNLENAFDTVDSPNTMDEEYLPQSQKQWNSQKYWTKLNRLSKVIRNSTGFHPPDIVAVCEIENAEVLFDLGNRPALRSVGYQSVHYESPDARGIDVALLYNPESFHVSATSSIPIHFPFAPTKRTRNILLVSGTMGNGDTLNVIALHWPSRRGGKDFSEPFRLQASIRTRNVVDSLLHQNKCAKIVICGDFNDTPNDTSVRLLMNSKLINAFENSPFNSGTHRYGAEWKYLDQWIYSRNVQSDTAYVYFNSQMTEPHPSLPGFKPKRSWRGNFFTSGYSDHLPIVLILNEAR